MAATIRRSLGSLSTKPSPFWGEGRRSEGGTPQNLGWGRGGHPEFGVGEGSHLFGMDQVSPHGHLKPAGHFRGALAALGEGERPKIVRIYPKKIPKFQNTKIKKKSQKFSLMRDHEIPGIDPKKILKIPKNLQNPQNPKTPKIPQNRQNSNSERPQNPRDSPPKSQKSP